MPIQDKTDAELGIFDASRDFQSSRNVVQTDMKAQLIAHKATVDGAVSVVAEAIAEAPELDSAFLQAKKVEWEAFSTTIQVAINAWDTFFGA